MEPRARAAERALKRMGKAVKTFLLYPPPHPMGAQAADSLMADLRQYMQAHGPLHVRVTKHALTLDSVTFEDGGHGDLALYFFVRRLAGIAVKPDVTEKELAAFLSIISMDRANLEAAGGVEYLLWQAEVKHVVADELTLEQADEQEILGLGAFHALIGRGRLSPAERERVVEILRSGPDQVARLLENVDAATAKVFKDISEAERVELVCQAIRALDRVILDEPLEDQPALNANLAAAQLHIVEPLRQSVQRVLLSGAEDDPIIRVLMDHLSPEQLAQVIFGALSSGGVADQVADYLRKLGADRERARAVLASLEGRLQAEGVTLGWVGDAVSPKAPLLRAQEPESPAIEPDASQIAVSDEEYELRLNEVRAIDEAAAIREVILTLLEVLHHEEDMEALPAIAESLAGHLPWMLEQRAFGLLAEVLRGLKTVAGTSTRRRAELASGLLKTVTEAPLIDTLLNALWNDRGTPAERELQACFRTVADRVTATLVRILGEEPRAAMRAVLCDLLVAIGQDHIQELGAFVGDSRWYLVRNIANILGRLRHPGGVPYLERLARHQEYRVRRETVDALASIGTEEAMVTLVEFIDDPDQRIRLAGLQSLDAHGVRLALPKLMRLLDARDLLNRLFELKWAAIETLGRIGREEALPALQRLARKRLVFGPRGRELRRLAAVAVEIIEARGPRQQRALIAASGS